MFQVMICVTLPQDSMVFDVLYHDMKLSQADCNLLLKTSAVKLITLDITNGLYLNFCELIIFALFPCLPASTSSSLFSS